MTPTQIRAEFKRMTLKIQALERGAVDEARALNAQRQGNVAFCLEILDALGLRMAVREGMREEIHDEIKRLKESDELQECANLLPDSRYMDPPDGGSPTIAVQLKRMIAELNAEIKRLKAIESAVNGE